jgi:HAD superfamily hydrolase (TIGR01509 family)
MTSFSPRTGIAAAVFDMDGTLLDTEPLYRDAIFTACAEQGYQMRDSLHLAQVGAPNDVARALFQAEYGDGFPFETFQVRMHELMHEIEMARGVEQKPGARELLSMLNARGIPTAVVTSTARPAATARLERAGFTELLDAIITRDDTKHGKPNPEPFLAAATRLDVAPESCLALEDSLNGIRAARAAGMMAVMVPDLIAPTEEITPLCHSIQPDLDAVRQAYFTEAAA